MRLKRKIYTIFGYRRSMRGYSCHRNAVTSSFLHQFADILVNFTAFQATFAFPNLDFLLASMSIKSKNHLHVFHRLRNTVFRK